MTMKELFDTQPVGQFVLDNTKNVLGDKSDRLKQTSTADYRVLMPHHVSITVFTKLGECCTLQI